MISKALTTTMSTYNIIYLPTVDTVIMEALLNELEAPTLEDEATSDDDVLV